ncbi:MAG: glycosyltransferase family 1 protein [Candidatus Moranbacteria bacterium]|nr:glycosyltransferase family 1 protein [Candidatus Moranbacteria bacterium]
MTIGIDARFYGSLGKGLGRYTQKLIEHLELIDTKNRYIVFLRRENFDEYQPANKNFTKVLADYQWYSFSEQLLFPLLLLRFRCDMMHFPHFNVPVLYRGKFIVTIHDLILIHFPTQRATMLHPLWYRVKFLAYKAAIWWAIHKSCHIMTVSEYTKQDILEHYRVDGGKITVAYEAIDAFCTYHGPAKSLEILRTYGLTGSDEKKGDCGIIKPYLLYVGNAYPHKNLEALIDVLHQDNLKDMTLVLVGKEDYFYRRLKDKVREERVKNVLFVGFVPDGELDVLYRFGRAYVFPSLYEGFGLPPLEAMGRGLPVLATHAASLPEILGGAALYFYPDQKDSLRLSLRHIWNDVALRDALRTKGYAQAGKFQWLGMAQATLERYR